MSRFFVTIFFVKIFNIDFPPIFSQIFPKKFGFFLNLFPIYFLSYIFFSFFFFFTFFHGFFRFKVSNYFFGIKNLAKQKGLKMQIFFSRFFFNYSFFKINKISRIILAKNLENCKKIKHKFHDFFFVKIWKCHELFWLKNLSSWKGSKCKQNFTNYFGKTLQN